MILIENTLIISDPLNPRITYGCSVIVENDLVKDILPKQESDALYPTAERLNGKGLILLPGLIDAHTHLYAALTPGMPSKGTSPQVFHQVLESVWWKFDKALTSEDISISGLIGGITSLKNGITTIIDHHSSPNCIRGSLDMLSESVRKCGIRACLAYEVSDRDGPQKCDSAIKENIRFLKSIERANGDLVRGLFGLHAVFTLSDQTIQKCAEKAIELDAGVHMHMAEHQQEVIEFSKTHKQRISEYLSKIGILGEKTLLAHTVCIDKKDIEIIRTSGSFNVHNPQSNMSNGVGIAPLDEMIRLDQPVGLGSDGFYDIAQEMIFAKLLNTLRSGNPSSFSDKSTLKLVYGNNRRFAEKIFNCQLGKIEPGFKADLILIAYDPFTPIIEENLSGQIISALSLGRIRYVMVNGKIVVKNGEMKDLDESQLRSIAQQRSRNLWDRF